MLKNRIIFMGTPAIAASTLEELFKHYEIIFVVTQPDRKKDRKGNFIFSETKQFCLQNSIKFYQPEKVKEIKEEIVNAKPDLIITCAYGQFVPESILNIPKYKSVNFHASILPKLRGGAPIQWAIINGLKETGITLMYMDKKMDHGNIIAQSKININPLTETYSELYKKLQYLIVEMIQKDLNQVFNENVLSIIQNEAEATYGLNILKSDRYIDWSKDGENIIYLINGLCDSPYALTIINDLEFKIANAEFILKKVDNEIVNGTIIKLDKNELIIKVRNGLIRINSIQAPNKRMLDIKSFLAGNIYFKKDDIFKNMDK